VFYIWEGSNITNRWTLWSRRTKWFWRKFPAPNCWSRVWGGQRISGGTGQKDRPGWKCGVLRQSRVKRIKWRLMSKAWVFALPFNHGGLGNRVMKPVPAYCSGSFGCSGITFFCKKSSSGYLVEKRQPFRICKSHHKLISDDELRKKFETWRLKSGRECLPGKTVRQFH